MLKSSLLLLSGVLLSVGAWAHGEDRHGPHGGYVRMPGAFHTEVLKTDAKSLKVYLLDMNWTAPTVKDSTVKAEIAGLGAGECTPQKDHFVCRWSKNIPWKKGTLTVVAKREGQQGNDAVYRLPLKLEVPPEATKAPPAMSHEHH